MVPAPASGRRDAGREEERLGSPSARGGVLQHRPVPGHPHRADHRHHVRLRLGDARHGAPGAITLVRRPSPAHINVLVVGSNDRPAGSSSHGAGSLLGSRSAACAAAPRPATLGSAATVQVGGLVGDPARRSSARTRVHFVRRRPRLGRRKRPRPRSTAGPDRATATAPTAGCIVTTTWGAANPSAPASLPPARTPRSRRQRRRERGGGAASASGPRDLDDSAPARADLLLTGPTARVRSRTRRHARPCPGPWRSRPRGRRAGPRGQRRQRCRSPSPGKQEKRIRMQDTIACRRPRREGRSPPIPVLRRATLTRLWRNSISCAPPPRRGRPGRDRRDPRRRLPRARLLPPGPHARHGHDQALRLPRPPARAGPLCAAGRLGARFETIRLPVRLRVDVRSVDRGALEQVANDQPLDMAAVRSEATTRGALLPSADRRDHARRARARSPRRLRRSSRAGPRLRYTVAAATTAALTMGVALIVLLPPAARSRNPSPYAHGADIPARARGRGGGQTLQLQPRPGVTTSSSASPASLSRPGTAPRRRAGRGSRWRPTCSDVLPLPILERAAATSRCSSPAT